MRDQPGVGQGDNPDAPQQQVKLCIDLDGTLVRTDLLVESVLRLASTRPLLLFLLPLWLMRGRAYLKQKVAAYVAIEPDTLPYDERVFRIIARARAARQSCILVTASHKTQADRIADHLGLFDDVVASDGETNLSGNHKATRLFAMFGSRGFDYMANHRVDLAVWAHARRSWIVNGSARLASKASRVSEVAGHLPPSRFELVHWVRALRLHQWLKNLLVFVPLFAAHRLSDVEQLKMAVLAFFAFGLCASSVYILNDLLDLQNDRQHPRKRQRPFACCQIPLLHGLIAVPLLACAGFAIALYTSSEFTLALAVYWLVTTAYSLWLKRVAMLDVTVLAGLYTSRIIAGALAISVALSFWLLAFSMFLFFSLAMLKRLIEMHAMAGAGREASPGRAYVVADLQLLQALGVGSGLVAILVLALYINSPDSIELYRRPDLLWLLCPVLLYWISRIWLLANRGEVHDDPVVFAATDRTSLLIAVIGVAVMLLSI